jgi:hypothetical protein
VFLSSSEKKKRKMSEVVKTDASSGAHDTDSLTSSTTGKVLPGDEGAGGVELANVAASISDTHITRQDSITRIRTNSLYKNANIEAGKMRGHSVADYLFSESDGEESLSSAC